MEIQKSNIGSKQRMVNLFLRLMAFVLTLVAAILLGVDKQTKVVPLKISPNLPPLNVPVPAKWQYLSAFVYSFVTDVIASSYAAISLIFLIANRNGKKGLELILIILDLVMMALLASSAGAAMAVGLIAYRGNSHVGWNKVCNIFDHFCEQARASFAVSLVGSLAFLLLIVLAALSLHKRSK
ncbi:hypothetical protein SLEP1_g204 [Rubroshorea leprosula]|uniref:CASP-like protein n=1 Tax=Rubroshorea leprosula TaxID=152421 RepID=A0AAV5H9S3_9ROSI|nr:hypothetical protein SLEP1_g204 [Rubroshorea leprosula]